MREQYQYRREEQRDSRGRRVHSNTTAYLDDIMCSAVPGASLLEDPTQSPYRDTVGTCRCWYMAFPLGPERQGRFGGSWAPRSLFVKPV